MMVKKIISGGQTGADIAGVKIAKTLGIETGGWMPKGFRTEYGSMPHYAAFYGMKETFSSNYQERTRRNVLEADLTIIFMNKAITPGSKLTINICKEYDKEFVEVFIGNIKTQASYNLIVEKLKEIILLLPNKDIILNIAGSRESKYPEMEVKVMKILYNVLT